MPPPTASTILLPPEETVRVWQERGTLRTTVDWAEMMHEEHAAAFTVAKIAQLDLLNRVRQSLDQVIREGGTYEMWRADILPHLQRAGWWGVVQDEQLTGTPDAIVVNDRRLRNIYRTNIRMSMAAGRWRKIQSEKHLFPYLRYRSDHWRRHPRLNHQSWHGIILPVDHPAWLWMFPPNGWGCNCRVEQVSEARMRREGWSISDQADALANPQTYPFERPDGTEVDVPYGIQPGFGYNPGTAHLRVIAERATATMEEALAAGNQPAADRIMREIIADPAFEQFASMPEGAFPIALLTEAEQQVIGAGSRVVMLPAQVFRKQLGQMPEVSAGHPELTLDDYRQLPDLVSRALLVAFDERQMEALKLIYFADRADRIWKVVVRQDIGRSSPAVVSFHRSRARNMRGETRGMRILLDRRNGV